jgi:hypothetical protein
MAAFSRIVVPAFIALLVSACGAAGEPDSASDTTATIASASRAATASASPHFRLTMAGPGFDGERLIEMPADQINGIIYANTLTLLYVRRQREDSEVLSMTFAVEKPNMSAGTYDFADENVSMSLGGFDDRVGNSVSAEAESGVLTLTSYSESDRSVAGNIDASFRSTNRPDEVYAVKGSFGVTR